MSFRENLGRCYTFGYDQCGEMLKLCTEDLVTVRGRTRKISYYNIPCAFDIETTSFYDGDEKVGIMYHWQFGFDGCTVMGRTWDQLDRFMANLVNLLDLSPARRLMIGVHNLGFEFQFMRKHFQWKKVFANDIRKPITAMTTDGLEFRCTWLLSGYSLAKLGDQLITYKYRKLTGDLDYSLMRHSNTPMTGTETAYCIGDVKVVMCYLMEEIGRNGGNIARIPMTKTGYVRRYARNMCFYGCDRYIKHSAIYLKYREYMKMLQLTPYEYELCHDAFAGGFTHANPITVGAVNHDVASYDISSSYPTAMLLPLYPVGRGKAVTPAGDDELFTYLDRYCCIFRIRLTGLRVRDFYEAYISNSKCKVLRGARVYNGRVVDAEVLETVITEQDFQIIRRIYEWDSMAVADMHIYKRGYLPRNFIRAILKLYNDKTKLKGVKGKEAEYMLAKAMLNALYGMIVTRVMRDDITYVDDWDSKTPDLNETINKYNTDPNRFTFYPQGVYVTSIARKNLFTAICELKHDYVYSDTDSVKFINREKHMKYIEGYNKNITEKLEACCRHFGFDTALLRPKTVQGVEKPMGIWEYEGTYKRFKTLGAKRYIVENGDGTISLTVSGLNKRTAVPYLLDKYGKDGIFDHFSPTMEIPGDYTGKLTHTYIDEPRTGTLTDYLGIKAAYEELSGIHLEPTPYKGSGSALYQFILKMKGMLIE